MEHIYRKKTLFADNITEAERDVGDQIQLDTLYQGVHCHRSIPGTYIRW